MRRLGSPSDIHAAFSIYSHPRVVPYLTYEPMDLAAFGPIFDELVRSGCFWTWESDGAVACFYKATRLPGRVSHVVQFGTLAVDPRLHDAQRGYLDYHRTMRFRQVGRI